GATLREFATTAPPLHRGAGSAMGGAWPRGGDCQQFAVLPADRPTLPTRRRAPRAATARGRANRPGPGRVPTALGRREDGTDSSRGPRRHWLRAPRLPRDTQQSAGAG